MVTRKIIALTRRTFVSKVMSLLFNTLSRFVIAFFPKEQESFNFVAAVTVNSDFGAQEQVVYILSSMRISLFLNHCEILACQVTEGRAIDVGERQ